MALTPASSRGSQTVLSETITLTDAQIKALPTTTVELVPAPGAGSVLIPLAAFVHLDPSAGGYTNVDASASFVIQLNQAGFVIQVFAEFSSDAWPLFANGATDPLFGMFTPVPTGSKGGLVNSGGWLNAKLEAGAPNGVLGDFTGGNAANTMRISVFYAVLDAA